MGFEQNLDEFTREDFSFRGNYRAIVENNVDPEKAGRVQVRIFGLHSPFASETPTADLPWAEPCLGLYWSGGHNIENPDILSDRYRPSGNETSMPSKNSKQLTPKSGQFIDPVEDDCGTGGLFTVPRKGTIVWIFFDSGDHIRPQYWATSPKQQDWEEQNKKIVQDVNDKRSNVENLRDTFNPDKEEYTGSTPANNASVQTYCSKPRVNFYPIDDIEYQDITSITSKNGTTFVIVNQKGKERYYIINKGTGTFVSEYGHRKTIVGTTTSEGDTIKCNDEDLVAGHKELHIVGDFDTYVQGNIFLQSDKHYQLNVHGNVGVVAKTGDVDVVVEKGNVNLDVVEGNLNAHVGGNAQAQIDSDTILKVSGNVDATIDQDLSATVKGKTSVDSKGDINVKSGSNILLEAANEFGVKCSAFKVSSSSVDIKSKSQKLSSSNVNVNLTSEFVVKAGSTFKVDPGGFGGDVQMSVPISNALHVGTFPGPGAGPSTPYKGNASSASEASGASTKSPISFSDSPKQEKVADAVTDLEKGDKVDTEGNPDISSNP
jgi:hypothetical protein